MLQAGQTIRYEADTSTFANAQIGYAPMVGSRYAQDASLRFLELTWREVEPEQGVYAWDALEEKYGLAALRAQGIHLVLRFVCDVPGRSSHLDIPDWLYDQTGDGSWYSSSYGKGYSPDYTNDVFRAAHRRVIAALAGHFDTDGFVTYVELGSLGHWGEWHIQQSADLVPMPGEAIRDQYAADYLDAFSGARLLMRRPFRTAAAHGLGLYNDMTGAEADTSEWLDWMQNGGWYAAEQNALVPMPEAWNTAPIGGELTSSLSMKELLNTQLARTLQLVQASHMSFLGPKTAQETQRSGYDAVLHALGYRLRVTSLQLTHAAEGTVAALTLLNEGAAPFYWDWDLNLYVEDATGSTLRTFRLPLALPELLPGQQRTVEVTLEGISFSRLPWAQNPQLALGIVDPLTGCDAVRFAMQTARRNGRAVLLG